MKQRLREKCKSIQLKQQEQHEARTATATTMERRMPQCHSRKVQEAAATT